MARAGQAMWHVPRWQHTSFSQSFRNKQAQHGLRRASVPPEAGSSCPCELKECAASGHGPGQRAHRLGHSLASLPSSRCQTRAQGSLLGLLGHRAHTVRAFTASQVPGCPNLRQQETEVCLDRVGSSGGKYGGSNPERRGVIPEFCPPTGKARRWGEQLGKGG